MYNLRFARKLKMSLILSQRARFQRRRCLYMTHSLSDSRSVYLGESCRNEKAKYRGLYVLVTCKVTGLWLLMGRLLQ